MSRHVSGGKVDWINIFFFFFFFFFLLLLLLLLLLLSYFFISFSHLRYLMVFHWSLSGNKSPQVSRTLLSILADLNNAVVWMVSTHPLIFQVLLSLYLTFGVCTESTNYNLVSTSLSCSVVFSVFQRRLGTYKKFQFDFLCPRSRSAKCFD